MAAADISLQKGMNVRTVRRYRNEGDVIRRHKIDSILLERYHAIYVETP